MNASAPPVSHARRFALGTALGAVLAAGLCAWAVGAARDHEALERAKRVGAVSARALVAGVEAAGGSGDGVRALAARFSADFAATVATLRVFDGRSIEASTVPGDTGEKAAPRDLVREEKDVFDRGQRLRAAVQTNREESSARKDEVEYVALASGGLRISVPVEREGEVTGMADLETARFDPSPAVVPPLTYLFFLIPVGFVLALWGPLGARRHLLAAAVAVGFVVAFWLFTGSTGKALGAYRAGTEETIRATLEQARTTVTAGLASGGIAASLDASSWDVDAFRRPRGITSIAGIDRAKLAASFAADAGFLRRLVVGIAAAAFGLAMFVGYGVAARLLATLRRHREAYTYVAPAMIGMVVLVFFPFLYGVTLSLTDANLYNTDKSIVDTWVGLKHYGEILGDVHVVKTAADGSWVVNYENFYWTFFFTIVWTVTNVAIGVSVGLVLALILNTKGLALRPIYRVLLIFPWAMPNYITALIWKGMFHQQYGVVNQALQIFGVAPVSWFDKPFTSYLTALATNGWLSFPFMMVVALGALQSISADLYEAARVDGASKWQQFRSITLPSLKPALVPAIILSVVWTFNMFNIIYLVTGGEPGRSTEILITQSYKLAFEKYQYGYAAAYSTVIFGILLVYGWFQNRVSRATEAN